MADQSVMDRIKQLDQEKAKLLGDAKKEALKKAEDAIAELHSLGFTNYRLQEIASGSSGSGSRKGTRQTNPDRECPICHFRTDPPHDARKHRSQKDKKPFTDAELADMGMQKVAD